MPTYLEVWGPRGPDLVPLEGDRLTVGKHASNDVSVPGDPTMSSMHAALERFPAGWCVRDLSSTNGTFVNGERVWGERPLRAGDEIRMGDTRLVYRVDQATGRPTRTQTAAPAPELTRREREVLLALCRPLLSGNPFTEPSSTRAIADELVVTEAAVRRHMTTLYDKFRIYETEGDRRHKLANDAIRRGAVSVGDLRARPPDDTGKG